MKFQKLTVLRDGAREIAGLLPLERVLDQLLRGLRKSDVAKGKKKNKKEEFLHTAGSFRVVYKK